MTTGEKLLAISEKYGLPLPEEATLLLEREQWIADAQAWLDERHEREAIEAEARNAAGNVRIFRRKQ